MRALLEYNLPDDLEDYERANAATKLCTFIWDFQQYLREQVKHGYPPDDADKIYNKWFEMMHSEGIDIDTLYR